MDYIIQKSPSKSTKFSNSSAVNSSVLPYSKYSYEGF